LKININTNDIWMLIRKQKQLNKSALVSVA